MRKGIVNCWLLLVVLLTVSCVGGMQGEMQGGMHGEHGSGVPSYAKGVHWRSLEEGRDLARIQKKPMVVDFAVPSGCDRCDFLQDNVYNRKEIVDKINADFIPIWVNLDQSAHALTEAERELGRKFEFNNDCLLLFLDHEERLIQDPEGKKFCFAEEVEPEDFNSYLDYVRTKYVPVKN